MNYHNENDPYAAQWLENLIVEGLIPDGHVDRRSIVDVRPADLAGYVQCHFFAGLGGWPYALHLAGWPASRRVWTGSCPCQPFSGPGRGLAFGDPRHLWPIWERLIRKCKPPTLFGEQVEGPAARAWLDLVCHDLEAAGYAIGAAVLPAASVGSPQARHRTWFVADANHEGRQRTKREGQPGPAWTGRASACGEPVRSVGRPWPAGPREVDAIPVSVNGVSGFMGRMRAYGNAIVPQVAAEFIAAFMECQPCEVA